MNQGFSQLKNNFKSMIDSGDLVVQGDRSLFLSKEMSQDQSRLRSFLQSLNDMSNDPTSGIRMRRRTEGPQRDEANNSRFTVNDISVPDQASQFFGDKRAQRTQTPEDSDGSFEKESLGRHRQPDNVSDSLLDDETQQANIKASLQSEDGHQKEEQFKSFRALRTKS